MLGRLVGTFIGGCLLAGVGAGTAFAGYGDGSQEVGDTGGGYSVKVTYTGSAAPKGGTAGKVIPSVPPKCWWKPFQGGDPASVAAAIDKMYDGPLYSGKEHLLLYGDKDRFKQAVDSKAQVTWYIMDCKIDLTDPDALAYAGASRGMWGETWPILVQSFPNGDGPPEPLVDPEALRDAAYAAMDIPLPTIERNPKKAGSGATLVNLPTWFWVNEAQNGPFDITASAGPVSATVVAKSYAWNLFSPFGGSTCSQAQITHAYTRGASDQGACTLAFTKSSGAGGFEVNLKTSWDASWTGVAANGDTPGGDLPDKVTDATTNVPVIEIQVPNR